MPLPAAAVPLAIGGAAFLQWLNNRSSTDKAADRQYEALAQAQGAITGGKDKALELFKPYLENAGRDYGQMRGLVQSSFFQQPYPGSFQSQQYSPQGFSFNPSAGNASFASWQPQGGPAGFNARPLPTMPQFQAPAAPPAAQGGPPMLPPSLPPVGVSQNGMDQVRSNTLGLGVSLPNKHETPNPYADAVLPPGARNPTQPLTLAERIAIYRQGGRGSGPYMPYDLQNPYYGGGLVGRMP